MHLIFKDKALTMRLKVRLYVACIVSTLRYSCEAWRFDVKAQRKLSGFNARCLAVIERCEPQEMARNPTYDMVGEIRRQRLTFAGHILRYGEERTTRQLLLAYFERFDKQDNYPEGSILEDAPPHKNIVELVEIANDRQRWREWRDRIGGKRHSLELEIVSTRELDRGGRPREEGTSVASRDAQARPKNGVS